MPGPETEVLVLDWSAVIVGRFLAARYDADPVRAQVELGLALDVVDEWFPVRALVARTLTLAGLSAIDTLDSWSALALAEQLDLPLFTASDEVHSGQVEILRPW